MGRSRSGASSKSISKPAPTKTATPSKAATPAPVNKSTPAAAPATATPATPATQQPVVIQGPGFLSNIASTMAGVAGGHVIGHAVTNALFGGKDEAAPKEQVQTAAQDLETQNPCNPIYKSFMTCLEKNQNDLASCQWVYDSFLECKKNPSTPGFY